MLGDTLMNAVGKWLENNRSPGRKVKQIDNRYCIPFFKFFIITGSQGGGTSNFLVLKLRTWFRQLAHIEYEWLSGRRCPEVFMKNSFDITR